MFPADDAMPIKYAFNWDIPRQLATEYGASRTSIILEFHASCVGNTATQPYNVIKQVS